MLSLVTVEVKLFVDTCLSTLTNFYPLQWAIFPSRAKRSKCRDMSSRSPNVDLAYSKSTNLFVDIKLSG